MLLKVDVTKRFPGFVSQVRFATNTIRSGLFGPSGSGKSTLMHMIAGLLKPDTGRITLHDRVLFDSDQSVNFAPEDRRIGLVFQHAHLFPHMNVEKNLHYGYRRTKSGRNDLNPQQICHNLQLDELLKRNVTSLSGGERQRVALGRTLLSNPSLVLMDEPLSGLDDQLRYQIIPYLQRVTSEYSIPLLYISHNVDEMRMMAEDVFMMGDNGSIIAQIEPDELARGSKETQQRGYLNMIHLTEPSVSGMLVTYQWGASELILVNRGQPSSGLFGLSSRDILVFKAFPEAGSPRNILSFTVGEIRQTEWMVQVELLINSHRLIAEIVPQSLDELGLVSGMTVYGAIKASAFRKLY
ncbi:MAG: molybdenum ABC transporter ATP-binding protein [Desulfobulbaceae bacterium]|mgnify:CR=1 FL=1|nr:MAG: molybdenum ABC transporter ATP-binding protein [Desulfobulbaceae bacterium]